MTPIIMLTNVSAGEIDIDHDPDPEQVSILLQFFPTKYYFYSINKVLNIRLFIYFYFVLVSGNRSPSTSVSQTSQLLLEDVKEKGISMAYICKLQPRPGTLILEKCVDFGVPPGPLLGKLKSGEDVTLENGTVVRSADVCEPNDPGPVFIGE